MADQIIATSDDTEVDAVQAAASLAAAATAGEAAAEGRQAQADAAEAQATADVAAEQATVAATVASQSATPDEARAIAREEVDSGMGRLADLIAARAPAPEPAPAAVVAAPPPEHQSPKSVEKRTNKRTLRDRWEGR